MIAKLTRRCLATNNQPGFCQSTTNLIYGLARLNPESFPNFVVIPPRKPANEISNTFCMKHFVPPLHLVFKRARHPRAHPIERPISSFMISLVPP